MVFKKSSSPKTIPYFKDKIKGWTVNVQRLLQPTRELVKSGYEARVESQGGVITR